MLEPPVSERDHALGPEDAEVTLVAYGDYECPYSKVAHRVIARLREVLGSRLRVVHRHFPLTDLHPHAEIAAEAAEAAGGQRRFWQMHDLLFASEGDLDNRTLYLCAEAAELDLERFAADLQERTFAARVGKDLKNGARSGVEGTPAFFINGIRHEGPWDFGSLLQAIEAAMPGRPHELNAA